MLNFKSNLHLVELCLTYRCNIKCNNCSNLCTQAPYRGDLTPDIVDGFIDDLISSGNPIGQITLHGGEPVLNPWIFDIIELLVDYRKISNVTLWLLTNNSCHEIREKTSKISVEYNIALGIAEKDGIHQIDYVPVNESPEDLKEEYTIGCFQTENCGICFNYLGWFPCSPMAAASRLFNYYPAALTYNDLTEEKCTEYFNLHCKHCGFALPNRRRVKEQTSTKTWIDKFAEYNRKKVV